MKLCSRKGISERLLHNWQTMRTRQHRIAESGTKKMNGLRNIDKDEFVVEPMPSGSGYYAYLPRRTSTRGVGDTPEAAMAQLVQMLARVIGADAIMDRIPVLSASACQFLRGITAAN